MTRVNFTRKTLRQGYERANGKCEKCGLPLKGGRGEGDHILPAELGGEATLANLQILCGPCHKAKTANDIRRIRKADRQRDKATGAIQPQGKMQGRQLPKKAKVEKIPVPPPKRIYQQKESIS